MDEVEAIPVLPVVRFLQVFTRVSYETPGCHLIVGYGEDGGVIFGVEEPLGTSTVLWQLCVVGNVPQLLGVTLLPRDYAAIRDMVRGTKGVIWISKRADTRLERK